MEVAMVPPSPEIPLPAFPAMRGMGPAPTARLEPSYAPMRGMIPVAAPQPEPSYAAMRGIELPATSSFSAAASGHLAAGKNPSVAIALSFLFPGGGQFYNGDTKKAFAVFALAILASCLTLYAGAPILGVPLSLSVWVWSFLDAGKVARGQKVIW
jgi:TM2 domain-containing membrane protein YozV